MKTGIGMKKVGNQTSASVDFRSESSNPDSPGMCPVEGGSALQHVDPEELPRGHQQSAMQPRVQSH